MVELRDGLRRWDLEILKHEDVRKALMVVGHLGLLGPVEQHADEIAVTSEDSILHRRDDRAEGLSERARCTVLASVCHALMRIDDEQQAVLLGDLLVSLRQTATNTMSLRAGVTALCCNRTHIFVAEISVLVIALVEVEIHAFTTARPRQPTIAAAVVGGSEGLPCHGSPV